MNVRLDESEHERLLQACNGRGCDKSTLVREALRAYLAKGPEISKLVSSTDSSTSRDLIEESESHASMAKTIRITKEDGTIDVYRGGRLVQTDIPPKFAGDHWRVKLA